MLSTNSARQGNGIYEQTTDRFALHFRPTNLVKKTDQKNLPSILPPL
jgi:hypothetical protein